jgi:DTW domain-containing protein YfiP
MHPKEYKHIKNNTGRLTHLSLPNSKIFVGVDFTQHQNLNAILNDPNNHACILFPSNESQPLETAPIPKDKKLVLILIDATWDSAKPILRQSRNLHNLPKRSFSHTKTSGYHFKRQPFKQALSTMESTHTVLEILNRRGIETITDESLEQFLNPFEQMVRIQRKFNP